MVRSDGARSLELTSRQAPLTPLGPHHRGNRTSAGPGPQVVVVVVGDGDGGASDLGMSTQCWMTALGGRAPHEYKTPHRRALISSVTAPSWRAPRSCERGRWLGRCVPQGSSITHKPSAIILSSVDNEEASPQSDECPPRAQAADWLCFAVWSKMVWLASRKTEEGLALLATVRTHRPTSVTSPTYVPTPHPHPTPVLLFLTAGESPHWHASSDLVPWSTGT
ncbi:unnamed protein product [Boreogadus saida]